MIIVFFVFLYMSFGYLFSLMVQRNDIADIFWGPGFILITVLAWVFYAPYDFASYGYRSLIVFFLISLWGLRLSFHIGLRNLKKKEDWRYLNWRKQWGKTFLIRSYLQVWMLQGAIMLIVSIPIILQMRSADISLGWLDSIGFTLFGVGFLFEAISDEQLRKFKNKKENQGKILTTGLWRYSRHPNYFGEALLWWGLAISCLHLSYGWSALFSVVLLTYLLLRVSGVSMLEGGMKARAGYTEYQKRTSAFIPWMPNTK